MQQHIFIDRTARGLLAGLAMLAGVVAFTGSGCSPSTETSSGQGRGTTIFFDLRDFFDKEVKSLQAQKPRVRKTVRLNGRESLQAAAEVNYAAELAPFIQSDINKPSWRDKYRVDSLFVGGVLEEIKYTAGDAALKTKELRVFFEGDKVRSIWVKNSIRSIVSESEQDLKYYPYKGYSIYGRQGGRFSEEKRFSVEVEF
jgi:hypothetical protein